jgi:hypothetical protein
MFMPCCANRSVMITCLKDIDERYRRKISTKDIDAIAAAVEPRNFGACLIALAWRKFLAIFIADHRRGRSKGGPAYMFA